MENKHGAAMLIYPNYIPHKRDNESVLARLNSFAARAGIPFEAKAFSRGAYAVSNGIAVVPIFGGMMKGCGYPDQSELKALMQSLKADSSVKGVLNVFDSPGGSVAGTADYGSAVADLATSKPCYAYCEDMCASAAYWAASLCNKVFANSTALVGSIGVISWLTDATKMYESMGIKEIPITTGKFKVAGDPSQEATPEIVDYMQATIDDIYGEFLNAVSAGRGLSKTKIKDMEAKVFMGQKAVDAGLVDKICSLEDAFGLVSKAANKTPPKSSAALSALLDLEIEFAGR